MGVRVDRIDARVSVATDPIDVASVPAVELPVPRGAPVALDTRANDAFIAVNRLFAAGDPVFRTVAAIQTADGVWPAGTFVVPPGDGAARAIAAARALGVRASTIEADAAGSLDRAAPLWRLRQPRVGVYHGWGGNMDEGWIRWVLEQFEFPYASVHDADIRSGDLGARFDVVVLPSATAAQMIDGLRPGSMPEAYTGGMTEAGVARLRAFVENGGTLVALDGAAELAIQALALPVADVTARTGPTEFFAPGTILRVILDPTEPLAYGMPPQGAAFVARSPAFEVHGAARVAASYPDKDLLLSGWLLGEPVLAGRAAVVEAAVGRGHAVLLGFRTEHRGQAHGTFKLLFNALLRGVSERGSLSTPARATAAQQDPPRRP